MSVLFLVFIVLLVISDRGRESGPSGSELTKMGEDMTQERTGAWLMGSGAFKALNLPGL